MKSQTTAQGDLDDVSLPLVASDILPPTGGHPSTPIETPVPLPAPMRITTSTPGPALKRKALAASEGILQAQKDWEKKKQQTLLENQGEQCGS